MTSVNEHLWQRDNVARYARTDLRPSELALLRRHEAVLRGRVLEVGCGAGRMLNYLVALGGEVHGVDLSPRMVRAAQRRVPAAHVRVGNLRELAPGDAADRYDAVLIPDNTLDVLAPGERVAAIARLRSLLRDRDSLLIFSSHNLQAGRPSVRGMRAQMSPRARLVDLARLPRVLARRLRWHRLEDRGPGWAVFHDPEGDWSALHVYVTPAEQRRELAAAGLEMVECVGSDGRDLDSGEDAAASPWLYYVARPGEPVPDAAGR